MRLLTVVVVLMLLLATNFGAFAEDSSCRWLRSQGASILERCGDRLNSFSLGLSEIGLGVSEAKRQVSSGWHAGFSFECEVPICAGEPYIGGFFIDAARWGKTARDEQAIVDAFRSMPLMAPSFSYRGGAIPPPSSACPLFELSIGGMKGRAVCIEEAEAKIPTILLVASDERVAFILGFQKRGVSVATLRDKVIELSPRFTIERAAGDAALLRWIR